MTDFASIREEFPILDQQIHVGSGNDIEGGFEIGGGRLTFAVHGIRIPDTPNRMVIESSNADIFRHFAPGIIQTRLDEMSRGEHMYDVRLDVLKDSGVVRPLWCHRYGHPAGSDCPPKSYKHWRGWSHRWYKLPHRCRIRKISP